MGHRAAFCNPFKQGFPKALNMRGEQHDNNPKGPKNHNRKQEKTLEQPANTATRSSVISSSNIHLVKLCKRLNQRLRSSFANLCY